MPASRLSFLVMYIWWLLKLMGVFFCGKLTKPCRHARTFQLVSQQVLTTKTPNFNKTAASSHHCPLRHPAPSLGHWYTGVYLRIFDPGPSNPTTFLGLCSPGDYRQSIVSNGRPHLQLYRKSDYIHYLRLYSKNTAKKGGLFDES